MTSGSEVYDATRKLRFSENDRKAQGRLDADQRDPRGGRFTNSVNDGQTRRRPGPGAGLRGTCHVIQPDAQSACAGYHNPLTIPPPGAHVVVTGPWVLDAPHGWNEIHPLERAEVLP